MTSVTISPELRRLVAERRQAGSPPLRAGRLPSSFSNAGKPVEQQTGSQSQSSTGSTKPLSAGQPLVALRVRRSGRRPIEAQAMALVSGSSSGASGQGQFHMTIHQTTDDGFVLSVEHSDGDHQRHLIEGSRHDDIDSLASSISRIRPEDHLVWSRVRPGPNSTGNPAFALEELARLRDAIRAEFADFIAEHLPALFNDQQPDWRSN